MASVDRQALLDSELQRVAVVLRDASLEEYERAVQAVTEAVAGLPDDLPAYEPRIYRITTNTDTARVDRPNAGNPGLLPSSAQFPGSTREVQ